jgi:Flp pilus assembly pilin Flp
MTTPLLHDERGATGIEYGVLAAVIAVALAGSFITVGNGTSGLFATVDEEYSAASD